MPTGLYDLARQAFAEGNISWSANTIRAVLIDVGAYTVNLATHQFLSSVPAGARIGTPVALAGKTSTAGVMDANDIVFTALTGTTVEALLLYQDTGVEATSRLIAYIDNGIGLPITPLGINQNVAWDNGANRIFRL